MAHPATLWATDGGSGLKDGTSLANAAAIDPGDANDIVTIINGDGPAANGTVVTVCADGPVITTAPFAINRDGISSNKFYLVGRNAADTANAQITLDANGGAFPVIALTAADYWQFERITATNTNKLVGNSAWAPSAEADFCTFIDCKGAHAYRGFDVDSNARYNYFFRCKGMNNADIGLLLGSMNVAGDCWACDNLGGGLHEIGTVINSIASGNVGEGFYGVQNLALNCTSYGNTLNGFSEKWIQCRFVNCLAVENGAYGYVLATTWNHMVNCAHYNNTSGGILGSDYTSENIISLTADPFVNAAGGDFRLNNAAGGGAALRAIAYAVSGQTGYRDIGALQSRPSILVPNRRGNLQ